MWTRRTALAGGLALAACAPQATLERATRPGANELRFAAIEQRSGGRLGVAAWDAGADAWMMHRADERFAMCSMFKWLLAAQMLHIDQSMRGFLAQQVRFNAADLDGLGHTPVTQANLARGWMSVEDLCAAAVIESDNGAANLLLEAAIGPEGFTRFLAANGDGVTRLDRNEPALNENAPGDPRDTTSPRAMAQTMQRFLLSGDVLNPASQARLIEWLVACRTGLQRLRAGFPAAWRVGDKTGTSAGVHNATTDVAIAWPPGRAPIIVACFLSESVVDAAARNAAHADVARIVAGTWS